MATKKTKAPTEKNAKAPSKTPAADKNAEPARKAAPSKTASTKKVKAEPKQDWLTITWHEDDVRATLEEHGIPASKHNLQVLHDSIEGVCKDAAKNAILNSPGLHWET